VTRLARAGSLELHIPAYVRGEVFTQQQRDIRDQIKKLQAAADAILRSTAETNLTTLADSVLTIAKSMEERSDEWLATEFQTWITDARATEHAIQPDHGQRVAAAYFAGTTPFRAPKHRDDIPDAFIWQTALDLVKEHGALGVVSADGRLRQAADDHDDMEAYATIEAFIETDECQEALDELTPAVIAANIERIKTLLPNAKEQLLHILATDIVHELAAKTVRHEAIPDDKHEATIVSVGGPENVEFAFADVEHYGDGEIGIPFTATVECELNYAIYKADYYSLTDIEDISIDERNDHYFDANQNYNISIEGLIAFTIDPTELEMEDLSDEDLEDLINDADTSTDITEKRVSVPHW
jgi:hypothetical protein